MFDIQGSFAEFFQSNKDKDFPRDGLP